MKNSDLHLYEAEFEVRAGPLRAPTYERIYATSESNAEFLIRARYGDFRVTFKKEPTKVKVDKEH